MGEKVGREVNLSWVKEDWKGVKSIRDRTYVRVPGNATIDY